MEFCRSSIQASIHLSIQLPQIQEGEGEEEDGKDDWDVDWKDWGEEEERRRRRRTVAHVVAIRQWLELVLDLLWL